MEVVAHQHVGVDVAFELACRRAKVLQEVAVVDVEQKAGPPVDAALDDVLRYAGEIESDGAGHR
jgi:hypothetical protein